MGLTEWCARRRYLTILSILNATPWMTRHSCISRTRICAWFQIPCKNVGTESNLLLETLARSQSLWKETRDYMEILVEDHHLHSNRLLEINGKERWEYTVTLVQEHKAHEGLKQRMISSECSVWNAEKYELDRARDTMVFKLLLSSVSIFYVSRIQVFRKFWKHLFVRLGRLFWHSFSLVNVCQWIPSNDKQLGAIDQSIAGIYTYL